MSIISLRVKNLLSFDNLIISNFTDINCIVGINNAGKSNLLKLIKFFYEKLDNKAVLPPSLNSNYSSFGSITIKYNITSRMKKRLKGKGIHFEKPKSFIEFLRLEEDDTDSTFELTLIINSNGLIEWSNKDIEILRAIKYSYPFFAIEGRHIDLHNWDKLWGLISSLKSFNISKLEEIFFRAKDLKNNDTYKEFKSFVDTINSNIETSKYSYNEKILSYIKTQLRGDKFLINEDSLEKQSDGTNSHKYIEIFLKLLIVLTRRDYITPIIYIDEPEVGLHPKKNEELIENLHETYLKYQSKVDYPTIIFSTHSPNIVKQVIKLFEKQQILHFYKTTKKKHTVVSTMNSSFEEKFLNIFSDNESRLFFSKFILFVEGETEQELFSNKKLLNKFNILKSIDVYKSSSNIIGSNINPSNTKVKIPYIFLFDADKIYNIKKNNSSYSILFKNSNSNLFTLPKEKPRKNDRFEQLLVKYSRGYKKYNKNTEPDEYETRKENLLNLKKFNTETLKVGTITNTLEKNKMKNIHNELKKYLDLYNVKYVRTTIEETLINSDNKDIFLNWILLKYNINLDFLLYKRATSRLKISTYKKRINNRKVIILNPRENKKEIIYFISKRRKYLDKLIVAYIRVIYFNGKFQNLESSPSKINKITKERLKVFNTIKKAIKSSHNITDKQEKQIFSSLEIPIELKVYTIINNIVKELKKLKTLNNNKTNGWVTEYLDFAISYIENNYPKKDFYMIFKKHFKELYDIIETIERKLDADR